VSRVKVKFSSPFSSGDIVARGGEELEITKDQAAYFIGRGLCEMVKDNKAVSTANLQKQGHTATKKR
jgi:hypothetical protein